MRAGTEDKKKLITLGVAGFFAVFALYFLWAQLFGGPSAPPPQQQAPVIVNQGSIQTSGRTAVTPPGNAPAGAAIKVGTTSGQLDPTLRMDAMLRTESLVYSGSGRNIFAGGPAEAPVLKPVSVKPIAPARPLLPAVYVPPPPPPTCPPTCAPINLKFFGTSTSASGIRKAFLLQGDNVFLASTGDIVDRRYRVVSISPTTILIEDIPNTNKQTLPLIPN